MPSPASFLPAIEQAWFLSTPRVVPGVVENGARFYEQPHDLFNCPRRSSCITHRSCTTLSRFPVRTARDTQSLLLVSILTTVSEPHGLCKRAQRTRKKREEVVMCLSVHDLVWPGGSFFEFTRRRAMPRELMYRKAIGYIMFSVVSGRSLQPLAQALD